MPDSSLLLRPSDALYERVKSVIPAMEWPVFADDIDAILALKKQLILSAFDQAGGSFTEAAKILGVHPNYLHRLVRNLDLRMALKTAG